MISVKEAFSTVIKATLTLAVTGLGAVLYMTYDNDHANKKLTQEMATLRQEQKDYNATPIDVSYLRTELVNLRKEMRKNFSEHRVELKDSKANQQQILLSLERLTFSVNMLLAEIPTPHRDKLASREHND